MFNFEKIYFILTEKTSIQIFWAFLTLLIGFFVSKLVGRIIKEFLNKVKLNQVIKRLGWEEAFAKGEIKLDLAKFFGEITRWCSFTIFVLLASEILGLLRFGQFLEKIIGFFPNIFIASIIFIITVYLVDFSYRIFLVSARDKELIYSKFLGIGIRKAIWILATLAILYQLKIVPELILSIFVAILALIVLAGGIAFGLGGKDLAQKILEELRGKFPK